mmetsp:Transcript_57311/g.78134  ORF Transcript_57311/g.78134 Transcript_57311/m.78134 type:complete len:348 (+) Transcript_57311:1967-3010(+)
MAHRPGVEHVTRLAFGEVPIRVELGRIVPVPGIQVRGGGAEANDVSLRDGVLAHFEALVHDLAHEKDERWVQTERLGDGPAHAIHLEEVFVVERGFIGHQALLLLLDLLHGLRVIKQHRPQPRRCDGRGVLPGEEEDDQKPRHFRVRIPAALFGDLPGQRVFLVFVPELYDPLQEVVVLLPAFVFLVRPPFRDDLRKDAHHFLPRRVSLPVFLGRGGGPERGQRGQPPVKGVVDPRDLRRQVLPNFRAHEAGRGGHDDELREDLAELHGPLVAPGEEVVLGLLDHLGHHRLQALRVHRVDKHLHLLLPFDERRVVHNALPKYGDSELVHGRLIENLVFRFDELKLGS